jgi:hypothetical protein
LRLLQVKSWTDSNATPDAVSAPEIGQVQVQGAMDANITTDSLGVCHVRGDLGGIVTVQGDLTTLQVDGDMTGRLAVSGNLPQASFGTLSGQMSVQGFVRSMTVRGDLSGEAFAFRDFGTVRIAGGDLSGRLGTNQALGNLQIRSSHGVGGALTGSVEAGDRIGTLRTDAASTGLIQSPQIKTLVLGGGFDGDIRAVSTLGTPPLARGRFGIGQLTVNRGDLKGTLSADTIGTLNVRRGNLAADVTVNGDSNPRPAIANLRVGGDAGGDWTVGGSVGAINILGEAHNLSLFTDGSVKQFTAARASGLTLGAGVADSALDDAVVRAAEVTNPNAILKDVRVGMARKVANTPISSDVVLAAPQMGQVKLTMVNDLGAAGGSVLWTTNARSIRSLTNRSTAAAANWTYKAGKPAPWSAGTDPMEYIV